MYECVRSTDFSIAQERSNRTALFDLLGELLALNASVVKMIKIIVLQQVGSNRRTIRY